jgi:hypothetical protein
MYLFKNLSVLYGENIENVFEIYVILFFIFSPCYVIAHQNFLLLSSSNYLLIIVFPSLPPPSSSSLW